MRGFSVSLSQLQEGRMKLRKTIVKAKPVKRNNSRRQLLMHTPLKKTAGVTRSPGGTPLRSKVSFGRVLAERNDENKLNC